MVCTSVYTRTCLLIEPALGLPMVSRRAFFVYTGVYNANVHASSLSLPQALPVVSRSASSSANAAEVPLSRFGVPIRFQCDIELCNLRIQHRERDIWTVSILSPFSKVHVGGDTSSWSIAARTSTYDRS